MTESEALGIVRDRVRHKGPGSDTELEQALLLLEKVIALAAAQAAAPVSLLTANEEDRIYGAACDAADSIRDEDVRQYLREMGFTDLAENLTFEDTIEAAVSSVHDFLLPLTGKDSQEYWDFVEGAARELVARAGLDWDEAIKLKVAEMRNARRPEQ